MYNLSVAGHADAWNGKPWIIDRRRCLEYTGAEILSAYGGLGRAEMDTLKRLPCIFAYESIQELDPHFGQIRRFNVRHDRVGVDYELHPVSQFLSAAQLEEMTFELEIGKWELCRNHWAVKDIDLAAELNRKGIELPHWTTHTGMAINLEEHVFDVALSFPGEIRCYVEEVVRHLEQLLGPDQYFYDRNYTAQLARPSLDTFLQAIFGSRSRLIVVFVGGDYQLKDWCGIEFRAIREIIASKEHSRIMYVRMDDGPVEGVLDIDGFVDCRQYEPAEIASFIQQRVIQLPVQDQIPRQH